MGGGLVSKRKYRGIRNSYDIDLADEPVAKKRKDKAEFFPGCNLSKILPYKRLTASLKTIDIEELVDLSIFASKLSVDSVPGVYRHLKPFLSRLSDLYMILAS